MIIDAHNHVGQISSPVWGNVCQMPENLLKLMDECGIDQAVIWPMIQEHSVKGHQEAYEFIFRATKEEPRLIGFAYIDPRVGPELIGVVRQALTAMGLKGLKFHPFSNSHYIDHELVTPYIKLATEFDVPVTIHSDFACRYSNPHRIINLARKFPKAKLIMAHMGLDPTQVYSVPDLVKDFANIYLDLSGIPDMPNLVKKAVDVVGAQRVIFGSDTPDLHPKLALEKVRLANLTPEQEELVLGGSITRLLKV